MEKYNKIVKILCRYKGYSTESVIEILKDRDLKYILFLLLKKYKCLNHIEENSEFILESKVRDRKFINYNCKKAKEKFLINRDFRELYFELDDRIARTN